MIHRMRLYGAYFEAVKQGKKKVEVRLNDEKRRKISVGDTIEFSKIPGQDERVNVQVSELRKYKTFQAIYEDISFQDVGCEGWSLNEMIEETYNIYTPDQERKWGALAITMKHRFSEPGKPRQTPYAEEETLWKPTT